MYALPNGNFLLNVLNTHKALYYISERVEIISISAIDILSGVTSNQ